MSGNDWKQRTLLLLGEEAMTRLEQAHVAVFGLGGVGGSCAEALCRAGVGRLTLVDNDTVSETNLNRQVVALRSTVGKPKTQAMRERLLDINPKCGIAVRALFFDAETAAQIDFSAFDYVIDAIDTVSSKLLLIECARAAGTPILCCLGTGNKLDPARLRITEIEKSTVCPLARVMRRELRQRGIEGVRALWSDEPPCVPVQQLSENGRHPPGSVSFVPPVAGMMLAGQAVRDLIELGDAKFGKN